jgi:hypothetical protein
MTTDAFDALTTLKFGSIPVRPDFTEFRRTAADLARVLADVADVPDWQRKRFVERFVERAVEREIDALVELYGPK